MKVSIQTDDLRLLGEALNSECDSIRFGSEFCEYLLPSSGALQRACESVRAAGKTFVYVTPRLSNAGIETLREHLGFLAERAEAVRVVVNDFGALNLLRRCPALSPHLGRLLLMVPGRSPWTDRHLRDEDPSSGRGKWLHELYASTSLGHRLTIQWYRGCGCEGVDVDWVPRAFPSLAFLVRHGLQPSVHLHLVPVTLTRRCHTRRLVKEASAAGCSRPCQKEAWRLGNEVYDAAGLKLFLQGNAVFRVLSPAPEDVAALRDMGVAELVVTMNRVTGIDATAKINELVANLAGGVSPSDATDFCRPGSPCGS